MSISRHQAVGAYRRWEPQSLDGAADEPGPGPVEPPPPQPPPKPEPKPQPDPPRDPVPPVQLPTAADIDAMFEDARREGHETGLREGAEQARDEALRIGALADGLDEALQRLDQDVAEELVGLAIEIARRLVRHALAENPEAVIETVRAALNQLPQAQARIHLHPDDLALVRAYLADQPEGAHHALIEDDSVSRGGCRVQTAGSEIDATLETRWRRVLDTLGRRDASWQESA
jgi:flagellar assembly protein FliH